jgi:hypothetical protein
MMLIALTLFAQLVIVGGDPAACKAGPRGEQRPLADPTTVRELFEMLAHNKCVRYLVPADSLERRLHLGAAVVAAKDWERPLADVLAKLGIHMQEETVVRVDGPPPEPPLGDADFARGIHCASPGHCTIDRKLLDRVLSEMMPLATGARIVPSIHDGKPDGFKLYAIRPGTFYAHLGFENGDTIQTINGMDMSSPEKALELYTKIRDAKKITVSIVRRGEPTTFEYTIR